VSLCLGLCQVLNAYFLQSGADMPGKDFLLAFITIYGTSGANLLTKCAI
jgi:hypothetical protein